MTWLRMHTLETKEHEYSEKPQECNFSRIYPSHRKKKTQKNDYKYVQKIKDNQIFLMNFKETQTAEWN